MPTFLTSKRFLSLSALAPALATFVFAGGASAMSTSAMFVGCGGVCGETIELLVAEGCGGRGH